MMKLLAASAALFTIAVAGSQPARAWCDEDCAYEMHEAAQESAYERAAAREEAQEEGSRYRGSDRDEQRAMRARMQQSERDARDTSSEAKRSRQKSVSEPRVEPEPAPSTRAQSARSKVATENSSITSGSTQLADDNSFGRATSRRDLGCKTFFPATGMTLSVPCD